ncbi:MAG: pyruvate kinase [Spirochaetes bacterium]|nr:pyruvate kinase [Spirochaetota bacterium]
MYQKKTKIIATISDENCDIELIKKLYQEGMNIVRLNTAHQSVESTKKIVDNVRAVSDKIAILVDTKGPEVRTKEIEEPIEVNIDDLIYIGQKKGAEKIFTTSFEDFVKEVPPGSRVLINDGAVILTVEDKTDNFLQCRALNSGKIKNKKSVNVPNIHLNIPALSEKDRAYVQFAIDQDLDFIAHSFVRNREDVRGIQELLDKAKSQVKVIAKIENQEGVDNIRDILEVVYGLMVARGDLGVETPGEEVPIIQKQVIDICIRRAKPVIVATQMLHSMIDNPSPTRAEISDVANAVYDGADAVMLSGETAFGHYPVEAVTTMARIALKVENAKPKVRDLPTFKDNKILRNYLAKCAVSAALEIPLKAIIVDTFTGFSARTISAYRGSVPVLAKCHNLRTLRELTLSYGIHPVLLPKPATTDDLIRDGLNTFVREGLLEPDDLVAIIAGAFNHNTGNGADFLEINTVSTCLHGRTPPPGVISVPS